MALHHLLIAFFVLGLSATTRASNHILYECVDANGSKQYTNIPANPKACKILNIAPSSPAAAASPNASAPKGAGRAPQVATPSNFPRVDRALQRERDTDRLRILENELATEDKLLAKARKELSDQESMRLTTETTYQRVLDRLEPFQKRVKLHEDNLANLRREISKVR